MTLVELLAALVIGLLVIGAAIASMLLSRNSAAVVTDVAHLQQQGSYALRVFGMQARQAGSLDLAKSSAPGMVSFNTSFTGFDGAAVQGTEGTKGAPDTVSFSNQPVLAGAEADGEAADDKRPRDCLANRVPKEMAGLRLDSTFSVKEGALMCKGVQDAAQPMVANVADFQVWYRVKASPTTIRRMDANEVEAAKLWGMVSSVEICLDLKGSENTGDQPSRNYVNCQGEAVPHKGVVHMLFRNVFDLRTQGAS